MKKYLPFAIIILAAGILIYFGFSKKGEEAPPISDRQKTQSEDTARWETKTDDQANITVAVTPLDLSTQSAEWKFDIVMDTHSVELDQDMTKSTILIDDQGKGYSPLNWDGSVGGHHRKGVLTFNQITPIPKSVELKITGIADTIRTFTWQLNK